MPIQTVISGETPEEYFHNVLEMTGIVQAGVGTINAMKLNAQKQLGTQLGTQPATQQVGMRPGTHGQDCVSGPKIKQEDVSKRIGAAVTHLVESKVCDNAAQATQIVMDLLHKYGAKGVPTLAPAHYEEFLKALDEYLPQGGAG